MVSEWVPKPASARPAEPFEAGNGRAAKHFAYSERAVAPLAERWRLSLLEAAPWLGAPAFADALDAYTKARAQRGLVEQYLEAHGPLDEAGKPRGAVELFVRLQRLELEHRARLGLDPASWVRIEAALASASRDADLAGLIETGRRIRLEAERRAIAPAEENHA